MSDQPTSPQQQPISIPCADGYLLQGTLHEAEGNPKAVILINPATAVPEALYLPFANYLTSCGFSVVTYEYRGIGRSRPQSLRKLTARMRDWADLDVEAVTNWAHSRFPEHALLAIGHSFGGHAIGLCQSSQNLRAALFIASHAGCLHFIRPWTERVRARFLLKFLGPLLCRLFGFLPGRALGLGEDLPRGVVQDWSRWTSLPHYFFDDPSMNAQARFARPRTSVLAIGFDDDPWATPPGIDLLVKHLVNCSVERRQLKPKPGTRIGHMGFFRRQHRDSLWPEAAEWLSTAVTGPGNPAAAGTAAASSLPRA